MKLVVPRGKYVLAVSGGVDSMVLLDILAKQVTGYRLQDTENSRNDCNLQPVTSNLELVVAHFNHGIRPDSQLDQELVARAAKRLKLPFRGGCGHLGSAASEETARRARYGFLNQIKNELAADAIITAHHQDDLIETVFINLIRGTGRLGLSSMVSGDVMRPLLGVAKSEIKAYAQKNKLDWREDETNQNADYLRNYLRLKILPKLTAKDRSELLKNLDKVAKLNIKINNEIATLSHYIDKINRTEFSTLPPPIGRELLASYLRDLGITDFDTDTIYRLSLAIKTAKANSTHHIKQTARLRLGVDSVEFVTP